MGSRDSFRGQGSSMEKEGMPDGKAITAHSSMRTERHSFATYEVTIMQRTLDTRYDMPFCSLSHTVCFVPSFLQSQ